MADKIVQLKDKGDNLYPIGVGGYDVYSTSETVIGKWIDGRPIYRKVITGTTPSNASSVTLQHGISNFYAIINVKGYLFENPSTTYSQPIMRVVADAISMFGIGVGDFTPTTFLFGWGTTTNYRNKPYYIVLEYIKTS